MVNWLFNISNEQSVYSHIILHYNFKLIIQWKPTNGDKTDQKGETSKSILLLKSSKSPFQYEWVVLVWFLWYRSIQKELQFWINFDTSSLQYITKNWKTSMVSATIISPINNRYDIIMSLKQVYKSYDTVRHLNSNVEEG